jgi:hypothetical protein
MREALSLFSAFLFLFAAASSAQPTPAGSEFQVNTYSTNNQTQSDVAMDAQGDFVVVWHSDGQDGDGQSVHGQRFASDGGPVGGEFQINTYTTSSQRSASVSMDADSDFVVVWETEKAPAFKASVSLPTGRRAKDRAYEL